MFSLANLTVHDACTLKNEAGQQDKCGVRPQEATGKKLFILVVFYVPCLPSKLSSLCVAVSLLW